MACPTCQAIDCLPPSDLALYSLQSGWRFRNTTYYFVANCPPGYDCQGYPIVIVIPGGGGGGDVVIPDGNIDPTGHTIDPFTFTLQCCNERRSTTVPGGTNQSDAASVISNAFYLCAQAQANCQALNPLSPNMKPVPRWIGTPGPVWPGVCVGAQYYSLILTALPLSDVEVIEGTLPPGLNLSLSRTQRAIIEGTPTAAGIVTFKLKFTATNGSSTICEYTIGTLGTTNTPPAGTVGTPYSHQMTAGGGTAPYTWAIVAGALPPGLSMSASGLISGTPTTAGSANYTIAVADSSTPPRHCSSDFTTVISAGGACPAWELVDWTNVNPPSNYTTLTNAAGQIVSTSFSSPGPGQTNFAFSLLAPDPTSFDQAAISSTPQIAYNTGPCNCTCHFVVTKAGATQVNIGGGIVIYDNLANFYVIIDTLPLGLGTNTFDIPFTVPAGTTTIFIQLTGFAGTFLPTLGPVSIDISGYIKNV